MAKPVDADDVEAALLAAPEAKAQPPENRCLLIGLNGNIFTECLNYATVMSQRLLEG